MLRIGYLTAMTPSEALRRRGRPARRGPLRQCAGRDARHEARHQRVCPRQTWMKRLPTGAPRDSMRGDEIKEGIKAFSEKRPPKF